MNVENINKKRAEAGYPPIDENGIPIQEGNSATDILAELIELCDDKNTFCSVSLKQDLKRVRSLALEEVVAVEPMPTNPPDEEPYQSAYEFLKSNYHNSRNGVVDMDKEHFEFVTSIAFGKIEIETRERLTKKGSEGSLNVQIGGDHYKRMGIQPWEIIALNDLDFWEGNALKYLLRYRTKNGVEDLKKISHYIQYLIEQEEKR
jgi:hypothetical protein